MPVPNLQCLKVGHFFFSITGLNCVYWGGDQNLGVQLTLFKGGGKGGRFEVFFGTRFCSKHNIMVQLTNMVTRWVSLTHFWTFWPPRAPNRPLFEQIDPLWKMIIPPHHRSFNISSVSLSHLPTKAIKGIKEGKEKGFKLRNEKKRETSITYC